jgi:hypothetical protein
MTYAVSAARAVTFLVRTAETDMTTAMTTVNCLKKLRRHVTTWFWSAANFVAIQAAFYSVILLLTWAVRKNIYS